MVTIGNDTLPGTITTLESAPSVGVNVGAPGTPTIVGQADLDGASNAADPNTAVEITRPKQARDRFGLAENSQLTTAVQDALAEGAYPVYAVAPPVETTTQDLSGDSGSTGDVENTPLIENVDDVTFTINSSEKETTFYPEGNPTNTSVPDGEVLVNPQDGRFYADEALGNSGDELEYSHADYSADTFDAINELEVAGNEFLRDITDFVALTDEKGSIKDMLETHVDDMEGNGDFAIGLAGAGEGYVIDAVSAGQQSTEYSDSYDNSRLQLVTPSRDNEGRTLIGSYVGARSRIGIDSTPVFKALRTQSSLQTNLSQDEQEDLVGEQVIPIEERSGNARIVEDLTTVSDTNTEEQQWRQGISRLVTDYVAELSREEAEPYIGEFQDPTSRNNIRGNVSARLKELLESRQLRGYSLVVEAVDDMTVAVDIGIDTADPLRNIELTVAAGSVQNGVEIVEGA